MGSIYSADPEVHQHHLNYISSYDTMKIYPLCCPTFGLTHSLSDFMDSHASVDPQCRLLSYLLIQFLRTSYGIRSFSWTPFVCRERCIGGLMVSTLSSSSNILPQWSPSGTSLSSITGHVQVLPWVWSTPICTQIARTYISRDISIMHAILLCSETSDCNKDEYQKMKYLGIIYEPLWWKYSTKSPTVLRGGLCSSRSLA